MSHVCVGERARVQIGVRPRPSIFDCLLYAEEEEKGEEEQVQIHAQTNPPSELMELFDRHTHTHSLSLQAYPPSCRATDCQLQPEG